MSGTPVSMSSPSSAPIEIPVIVDVPLRVMFPLASGRATVGRTPMFWNVSMFRTAGVGPLGSLVSVMVSVICEVVMESGLNVPLVATLLMFRAEGPPPLARVTSIVTVALVSNSNPAGAVRIIVPFPISALADSVRTGPVKLVYVPPTVVEGIAVPPVAKINVAALTEISDIRKTSMIVIFLFIVSPERYI